MKRILTPALAIACLIFLAGFIASTSVTKDENETPVTKKETSMACAPSPQNTNPSTTSNGDLKIFTFLSDEQPSKFKYESFIFELGRGQTDNISHRHDCDVFLTILEGTLLMGQEFKKPDTVRAGEIFHERRNVIHSISTNPSKDKPMKAFVVSIRKDGRAFDTPLYPKNK